ncbi:MAG TPA: L-2-hydroxyglutarate oxidase [Acidimicrobiia bacterium]|nr:L-2-hydroxyglutarate oxidase [Acidimicrobiia bacterium]
MSDRFDFAVIGGGIVGLATATALSDRHPGAAIAVLEAESEVGVHQSGHNSGVLHSGLYYTPGSLKARLCVDGRRRLLEFCATHEIDHRVTGKLVVALDRQEVIRLERLHTRGNANGLVGIERLGRGEWAHIEPHIIGVAALHVPEAGVVDFPQVVRKLADQLKGEVFTRFRVTSIRRHGSHWELAGPAGHIVADRFVACAGLQADRVARLAGAEPPVRIVPFRGEYFSLTGPSEKLVRHLVYPVPDPRFPFLGVHFTRRIDGVVEVGPNAVPALGRHHYRGVRPDWGEFRQTLATPGFARLAFRYAPTGISEIVRSRSARLYARGARRLLPALATEDLAPAGAGVRAQAVSPDGRLVDDFSLLRQQGALHVLNAPSPAATASLAIGEHIAGLLDQ